MSVSRWLSVLVFTVLSLSGLPSCQTAKDARYRRDAKYYAGRDAITDARGDFHGSHYRIYGRAFYSATGYVHPGLSNAEVQALKVRWVPVALPGGHVDVFESEAESRYADAADAYAAKYNKEMARLINTQFPHR